MLMLLKWRVMSLSWTQLKLQSASPLRSVTKTKLNVQVHNNNNQTV